MIRESTRKLPAEASASDSDAPEGAAVVADTADGMVSRLNRLNKKPISI